MNAARSSAVTAEVRGADAASTVSRNPRILFLIRSFGRGGAQRQLVTLATALQHAGWDVAAACFYSGGAFQRDLVQANVPVIDLRKRGRWDVAGFGWRLWRAFRENDPDVVHGYLTTGNLLALLARFARRRTRVVWGVRSAFMDRDRYDWMTRLTFGLTRRFARFADAIIVNSEAGATHHAALGYPAERIRVIPNGIDTRRFRFDAEGRARKRKAWGIPDDAMLVGLVGRLDPMKDHPTFLKAAALLAKHDCRWRFVCVGGGTDPTYAQALASLACEAGLQDRLVWAGPQDDMPAVYSALDVAASTSYGEGFPNVIAEAMACGRPCVATDVGDSARIVGRCGAVVAARNPEAFAAGVASILQLWRSPDTGGDLPAAARARIVEHYALGPLLQSSEATLRAVWAARGGA
ncbi:MAG: glycosyltransferase [Rhodanobacteraceae bacterium]